MEEINLKDLFDYFISKWFIIILFCLIFALFGVVYSLFLQKPMYNSYATMVLATNNETVGNQGITASDITLNKNLISTYRGIMRSNKILGQVISNLNLNLTNEELKKMVSVTTEDETELIKISVNDANPKVAKEIANEIAKVFSNEIVNIYSIKNVSIIDYAESALNPYNVNIPKQIVISILIGLVLAIAIIFTMFYFDTTIKSTDEIESKIGLPTLGTVPMRNITNGGRKR